MKKKRIAGALIASTMAAAVMGSAFAGCSLVSSNSAADLRQVIAEINISHVTDGLDAEDERIFSAYKSAVDTASIYKNELVAAYLNVGYSYVQNYGYTYAQMFDMLVDSLVETTVLTQYAVMYVLDAKVKAGDTSALENYKAKQTYVEKLEYLLDEDDIKIAKYGFYSSLNAAIDSYEQGILDEDTSEAGTDSRDTPTGVNVEDDDYYPKATAEDVAAGKAEKEGDLFYNVYTGYAGYTLAESGAYETDKLEGTTKATRTQAYREYLESLTSFGLIDMDSDNLLNVSTDIKYFNEEYASRLESRLIEKYNDLYEDSREAALKADDYKQLKDRYNQLHWEQGNSYAETSGFESALDNLSDTSFILYSPDTEGKGTYGYVYNILLPFDSAQSIALTEYQALYTDKDTSGYTIEYYRKRNDLLKNIKTYDRREPWFNGTTKYAFDASKAGFAIADADAEKSYFGDENRTWLFFEDNLTKADRYKPIEKYIGKYSYNGRVYYNEDKDKYEFEPAKLTIDDMLKEFAAYVNYVLGADSVEFNGGYVARTQNSAYYTNLTEDNFYTEDTKDKKPEDREINYDNFIYATGKVNVGAQGATYNAGLMDKTSTQYKALSAVNELQYAYTTDTGILSKYIGYSVTLGDTTGYIKEFEAACHEAIERGAGSFSVCAGDYGWHLIYVTYTFGDPSQKNSLGGYDEYAPVWTSENIEKEGTFENLFYEWTKSSAMSEIGSTRRTEIINRFKDDKSVTKYQSRYDDLRNLG